MSHSGPRPAYVGGEREGGGVGEDLTAGRSLTRLLAVAGGAGLAVAVASCGGLRERTEGVPCSDTRELAHERAVEVPYEGPNLTGSREVGAAAPNLVVQVTNTQPEVERVRLRFDGESALDVDLPKGRGCGMGEEVYSLSYSLEPGVVEVALDLQGSRSYSKVVVPAEGTVWAVVQVQSERSWDDVSTFDEPPGWG